MRNKIVSFDKIKFIFNKKRNKKKKLVLCHGVFDLLHIGHLNHFKDAKTYGDTLIVSITSDKFVGKGPGRPAFNENQRAEAIAAMEIVDFVVINNFPTSIKIVQQVKPNVYCKGPDYKINKNDITQNIKREIKEVKKYNGKIVYTKGETFSSSKILNSNLNLYPKDHREIIKSVKKNYSFSEIKSFIDKMLNIKVLVIGELIIDEYNFCETIGKSGKEPVLVLRDIKTEKYLGGSAAIARHLSSFCNKISLLTMLGEKQDYLKEIKKNLPKNIVLKYIKKKNSPTIIKKRFLDHVENKKVLGVYSVNDEILRSKDEKTFNKMLLKEVKKNDLVIVSDYGHGFISDRSAKIISKNSKFLALNAQINASNVSYHSMRKYKNIDCLIINDREIRHELRDQSNTIENLVKKLSAEQKIKKLIVTKGSEGSLAYDRSSKKFYSCPAFSESAVDKIGAGDTMLSIVALCLKLRLGNKLSLMVSSLAAAESVKTLGNKTSINKVQILKTLDHLLK